MLDFRFFFAGLVISLIPDVLDLNAHLSHDAKIALRLTIIMVFFWLTEAIPNSITALIPILVSPFFFQIELKEILKPYSSSVVFLLLGGFILAKGFEKSNLHKRLAMGAVAKFGKSENRILLCFILATSFFSMWLSNTATCLLMLPIAKFIVDDCLKNKDLDNFNFSRKLILSIAYSSSIGGMATPIGTIPNAAMVSFLNENYDYTIDFLSWTVFMMPLVLILLTLLWIFFSTRSCSTERSINMKKFKKSYSSLGVLAKKEKISCFVLLLASMLWIFKSKINYYLNINLSDASIAIFCGCIFFLLPAEKDKRPLLGKLWFKDIPWNILILFGGGLSMASIIVSSGLAEILSENLNFLGQYDFLVILIVLALFTSILTEFTSNTATTFLLLPLLSIFAINNDISTLQILLPVVLAASCAFMMPISTPPNAIVFSTNRLSIPFMVKTGFVLNLMAVSSISIYIYLFGNFAFK